MNALKVWTIAARPKTLIIGISPVLIGVTLALSEGPFNLTLFLFTLLTSLSIQIGTNMANDYFDCVKGSDTVERKGFLRVTQAGLASPDAVKKAVIVAFSVAFLSGCYLIWVGGIAIGFLVAISILLGVIYTGGPFPLAYLGLGEIFAFTFFGPVATAATYYLQTGTWSLDSFIAGIAPGALCIGNLIINNIRDIDEDRKANKKTLVVRFGRTFGKIEYLASILLAFIPLIFFYPPHPFCMLALLILLPAIPLMRAVIRNQEPRALNALFAKHGQLIWLYTLLFCTGLGML